MRPGRHSCDALAKVLLAVGLTASGLLAVMLIPCLMKLLVPRLFAGGEAVEFAYHVAMPGSVVPGLIGGVLTVLLVRTRHRRMVGGALLLAWLAVSVLLPLAMSHFRENPESSPWPTLLLSGFATLLLTTGPILFTAWLRCSLDDSMATLQLFACFFLGQVMGLTLNPVIEWRFPLSQQGFWGSILLAGTGVLFAIGLARSSHAKLPAPSGYALAPTWSCRVRWMLLGGLPESVILGATTYISTDISPIPMLYFIPLLFCQFTWLVAFARMTKRVTVITSWLVQFVAGLTIVLALWLVVAGTRLEIPTRDWVWLQAVIVLQIAAALSPHRVTLPIQIGLLALVLLLVLGPDSMMEKMGMHPNIALHLLSCVVISWGCHGDAVQDLSEVERLPEFWLCMLTGVVVCGLVYRLPAWIPAPPSWGIFEYPLVLVACLVVRVELRMWRRRHSRGADETPLG